MQLSFAAPLLNAGGVLVMGVAGDGTFSAAAAEADKAAGGALKRAVRYTRTP